MPVELHGPGDRTRIGCRNRSRRTPAARRRRGSPGSRRSPETGGAAVAQSARAELIFGGQDPRHAVCAYLPFSIVVGRRAVRPVALWLSFHELDPENLISAPVAFGLDVAQRRSSSKPTSAGGPRRC